MKRLIRLSHRDHGACEQEEWINAALVEESFELLIVRDDLGDPIGALDVVRPADGRLLLTQRAVLTDAHSHTLFTRASLVILDRRLAESPASRVHVRGAALAAALDSSGWSVSAYAGAGRYAWEPPSSASLAATCDPADGTHSSPAPER